MCPNLKILDGKKLQERADLKVCVYACVLEEGGVMANKCRSSLMSRCACVYGGWALWGGPTGGEGHGDFGPCLRGRMNERRHTYE